MVALLRVAAAQGGGVVRPRPRRPRPRGPARVSARLAESEVDAAASAAGGVESNVEVRSGCNGRGLFFCGSGTLEGLVLRVPASGVLCVARSPSRRGHVARRLRASWRGAPLPPALEALAEEEGVRADVRLAAMLAWASNEPENGPLWAAYNGAAPSPEEHASALLLSDAELADFQDDAFAAEARARREAAEYDYDAHVAPLGVCDSREAFLYHLTNVQSRTFGQTVDGEEVGLVVPYADMMNHSLEPNCNFKLHASEGEAEPRFDIGTRGSKGGVPSGAEAFITYGDLGNRDLQLTYGFTVPGNPHGREDGLVGPVPLDRLRLGRLVGGAPDAEEGGRRAAAVRSLTADGEQANQVSDDGSEQQQAQAASAAVARCTRLLGSFPTDAAQDEAALARGEGSERLLSAVRYRLERKRVVAAALDLARRYQETFHEEAQRPAWASFGQFGAGGPAGAPGGFGGGSFGGGSPPGFGGGMAPGTRPPGY